MKELTEEILKDYAEHPRLNYYATFVQNLANAILVEREAHEKTKAELFILRKLLWLRHGCGSLALYGDDGELQCNTCFIDFKRLPAKEIMERFEKMGMEKLRHSQEPRTNDLSTTAETGD